MVEDENVLCKLATFDKFVIFVDVPSSVIFHFFGDILEETGPARRRSELGDEEGRHLNTFVRCQE